jgi:hypothetical protein
MAKRKSSTVDAAYDHMGQPMGAAKGEPNPSAVEKVEEANDLEPLVDVAQEKPAKAKIKKPKSIVEQILAEAQENPAVVEGLADLLAGNERTRSMFGLQAGTGPALGDYNRDYTSEPALRVFGGVEVAHPKGFTPLPPGWLPMYKGQGGDDTNDPALAVKDGKGQPIKTERYKEWIDHHKNGTKMDSNVRFDIAAEETMQHDQGVELA